MKKPILYLLFLVYLVLFADKLFAQVPIISYSSPTNIYTVGTTISTLTPTVGGGAPAPVFTSTPATFASIGASVTNVATDASGNVYAANFANPGNIYKWDSNAVGGVLTSTGTSSGPSGITVDGLGNIYVSDQSSKDVYEFNSSGTLVATVTGFTLPLDLSCDASNNVYVADLGAAALPSTTGTIVKIAAGTHTKTTLLTGLTNVYGVAVSGNDIFFSQTASTNTIIKVANGVTGSTTQTSFATGLSTPRYINSDASGNIYVADLGSSSIKQITPGGSISTLINTGAGTTPRDVAINSYGVVYIANSNLSNLAVASNLYTISPALPAGLTFDTNTGNISGTPTTTSTATAYSITAHNASGNSTAATVTITVNPIPPSISYTTYTGPVSYLVSTTITTLIPTNTGGTATYSISPALATNTGLTFNTATGAISGTPTLSYPATDYTVTATNAGGTDQAILNINTYKSYSWIGGTSTAWATPGNWSPATVPSAGDQVIIGAAATTNFPTISAADVNLSALTLENGATGATGTVLTVTGHILTITGDINYENTANKAYNATITGTGTIIGGGDFNVSAGFSGGTTAGPLTLTSSIATLTLTGDISLTSTHVTNSQNAVFAIAGTTTVVTTDGIQTSNANAANTSTITVANGETLNFTGTAPFSGLSGTGTNTTTFGASGTTTNIGYTGGNQSIFTTPSYSFVNLKLSGTGTKALASALTVGGTLTNNTGVTLSTTSGLLTVTGATTNTGTITNTSTSGLTFTGAVTNTGGTIAQSATSGLMKFTAAETNAGTINQTAASGLTFSSTLTNSGTITQSGTGAMISGALTNSGIISATSTGSYTVTTIANNSPGTITFGGGANGISGATVTNASGATITLAGTTTIGATTAVTNNGIFNAGTGSATFTAAFGNSATGTLNFSTGTTTFSAAFTNSGTINQTGSGTVTFNNTFSNSKTVSLSGSGGTMAFASSFTNSVTTGSFTATAGAVTFSTAGAQTITNNNTSTAVTFNDITFGGSGAKTLTSTKGFISSGTVTMSSTATLAGTAPYTNNGTFNGGTGVISIGAFTNGTGANFNSGTGAVTFSTTVNNTGTITNTSNGGLTFTGVVTNNPAGIINQSAASGTMTFTVNPTNTGNINQTSGGALTFSAALNNAGTINRTGTGTITFFNGASTNSGTIIQGGSSGLMAFPNTLNNSGTITQNGAGGITFSGIVTNTSAGIINQNAASGTVMTFSAAQTTPALLGQLNITNAVGVTFSGALTNSAAITGTRTGDLTVTTALINNSAGNISQSAGGDIIIGSTTSTVANSGTISQTGSGNFISSGTGTFTNNSGAGITFGTGTANAIAGAISNAGSFDAGSGTSTFSSTFTNSGTASQSGGSITFPLVSATVFTNSAAGVFTATGGAVTFSAAGNQTITNNNTSTAVTFNNLNISTSGTKALAGNKFVIASSGVITLSTTGTTIFNPGAALLTLNSDATSSAALAALPSGTSITAAATVNVQRFITGNNSLTYRGYRLLSSAINDSDISGGTGYWDLSFLADGASYLTGAAGGVGAGGFNATGNPTLYLYRDDVTPDNSSFTTGNYRAITQINTPTNTYSLGTLDGTKNLPVGTGVMYFYRGNFSSNASIAPQDHAFTMTGPLNTGQVTVKYWYTGTSGLDYTAATGNSAVEGFNLVGNPYPSTIDWETFNSASNTTGIYSAAGTVSNTIYTINPSSHVYATYTEGGGNTNGGSQYIASGQGFFVQASGTGAQLIFNETAKAASSQPSPLLLNSAALVIPRQYLRLKLVQDSVNAEDIYLGFRSNASSAYVFNEDAPYLSGNGTVSLSSFSADNRKLAINFQPLPKQSLVIPINAAVSKYGVYQLNLTEAVNIPSVYDIWLEDTYLKDSIDIKHNPLYSFNITTDPGSYNQRRFNLVIRQNPALAVHLLSFAAVKETADVKLTWTVENEADYTHYILQRSTNGGKSFTVIDSLTSANLGAYTDLDLHPAIGLNQYRLEQVDMLGNITYSSVVTVLYVPNIRNILANRITVYPNPVNKILNLKITEPDNAKTTAYNITITSGFGYVVKKATSAQPYWQEDVSRLFPGTYFIRVNDATNNALIGITTFIKK